MITFHLRQHENFTIVTFSLTENAAPNNLSTLTPPDPIAHNFAHKGVVLSGRGPVWLYCFLTHFYHPTKFVATYDPRLQGAVVVETHGSPYQVGDVIPLDAALLSTALETKTS